MEGGGSGRRTPRRFVHRTTLILEIVAPPEKTLGSRAARHSNSRGKRQNQVPMNQDKDIAQSVRKYGFAVVARVLPPSEINRLISSLAWAEDETSIRNRGGVYAIRNLLDVVPAVRHLASSPTMRRLLEPVLGAKALPVRGILFDKPLAANWKVPWHQDLTIAVRERRDVPGFGPWSLKAGVLHVQPPVAVLENMLAVRIHLDDCGGANGPLRVIPGSHLLGRLTTHQISLGSEVSCSVEAGWAILMRPLLPHASSTSRSPSNRRVIHVEFASCRLPGGLDWYSVIK
jgi:Phytanoyl-CoA dioxygenase (PhyH)